MAKIEKLPAQHIISAFKGVIDYYEWKGIPVVRKWPLMRPRTKSAAELATHQPFTYIIQLAPTLPPVIVDAYRRMAVGSDLTWRDWLARAYIRGIPY